MGSKRLFRNSIGLLLLLCGTSFAGARQRNDEQGRDLVLQRVADFFGKETLTRMQQKTFSFNIRYQVNGGRKQAVVTVQKKQVAIYLSDTVKEMLQQFLNQGIGKADANSSFSGTVTINNRTGFNGITPSAGPVIAIRPVSGVAMTDTFEHYLSKYLQQYPGDCEQVQQQVRQVVYQVMPFKKAVISNIGYTGKEDKAFRQRFRSYMNNKVPLWYSATTEGCYPDNVEHKNDQLLPEGDIAWCMVNLFGHAQYYTFKIPAGICN